MVVRFHGRFGHQSAAAIDAYERAEMERLGLGDPELWVGGSHYYGHPSRRAVGYLGRGMTVNGVQLLRLHRFRKQGEGMTFSPPDSAVWAMHKAGLLGTARMPFGFTDPSVHRAMRRLNRYAYGRTTEYQVVQTASGQTKRVRVTKRIPVDLVYLHYRGITTRSGEVLPQNTVYLLNIGRAADGKFYALDWRSPVLSETSCS